MGDRRETVTEESFLPFANICDANMSVSLGCVILRLWLKNSFSFIRVIRVVDEVIDSGPDGDAVSAESSLKAMDDIGVVMTPFGDVVKVILVVNSYVFGFLR